ncbi:MAG TPA: hypothetical protein VF228_14100 [Iamia sp.]
MTAPKADRRDYLGCGLWVGGFLLLVVVSFAIGVILRPSPPEQEGAIGPDDIALADVGPRVDGYRLVGGLDEVDDPCVILFRGDEEITGQCGVTRGEADRDEVGRYTITSSVLEDGTTAVFAPVPPGTATVVLELSDGSTPEVDVQRNDDADVSFFLYETEEDVVGPATFLGTDGEPIPE